MYRLVSVIRKYVTDKNIFLGSFLPVHRNSPVLGKRGSSSAATYSDSGVSSDSDVSGNSGNSGLSSDSGNRGGDLFIPHWMNLDEGGRVKSNQWEEERTSECRQKSSGANMEQFLPISKRSKMMKYVIRLRKKNPFNHKVIEITKGSHFKIPHIVGSYTQLKDFCKEQNLLPIVAHTNGINPHNVLKNSIQKGICLILGNESTGPHDDVLTFAKPISLPMHEMTNSLNVFVAASILIHYLKSGL
ncbi:RNA methyltransferase, putative [Plasmodium ovale wallikeri]|uniref:RNA methyltransferase, putative n=1 Tax=Plasmodium ovale wallikeri TaxID=864142 RepID=A0A1A8YXY3_PLAOA|nr:RNA methyltransferase, putative [Plasmodium ovale wallikeri]SBT36441.1 RNA methyltransferase, putative [Plasmodium ovale wallikeri]